MKAYQLTTYENDSYSYSGISESEIFIHLSKEGAINRAISMKLKIVEYCKNANKEATIEEIEIYN